MGKMETLTPETLEQIDTKFVSIDYFHELSVFSKFGKNPFTVDFWAKGWNVTFLSFIYLFIYLFIYFFSEARAEIKPFDRFWRMMALNAWNHARMCLFAFLGVKVFNFNIWPYLPPPPQKKSNFAPRIAISSQNDETWKSKYIRNYWTNVLENLTQC